MLVLILFYVLSILFVAFVSQVIGFKWGMEASEDDCSNCQKIDLFLDAEKLMSKHANADQLAAMRLEFVKSYLGEIPTKSNSPASGEEPVSEKVVRWNSPGKG